MLFSATIKSFIQNSLDYQFPVEACLINTDNIVEFYASGANDSVVKYNLNPYSDKFSPFVFITDEAPSSIVTGSNVSAQSNVVALPVFEEWDVTDDSVTHYYNVADIVWANTYQTDYSEVYVLQKGWSIKKILVDYTIADVLGLADTGTTA
jgi:hypothetical protein